MPAETSPGRSKTRMLKSFREQQAAFGLHALCHPPSSGPAQQDQRCMFPGQRGLCSRCRRCPSCTPSTCWLDRSQLQLSDGGGMWGTSCSYFVSCSLFSPAPPQAPSLNLSSHSTRFPQKHCKGSPQHWTPNLVSRSKGRMVIFFLIYFINLNYGLLPHYKQPTLTL